MISVGLSGNQIMWLSPCSQSMFSAHVRLAPLTFQPLHLALEEFRFPLSGLTWTNCGISFSADSGHMALQLCHLLAELAFLLSELLQLLTHLPELLHQGSTFNLVALQLVNQLSILAAGHTASALADSTVNLHVEISTFALSNLSANPEFSFATMRSSSPAPSSAPGQPVGILPVDGAVSPRYLPPTTSLTTLQTSLLQYPTSLSTR